MTRMNYKYLNDNIFLKQVDNERNKEQYVKITVLDSQERPIKDIQGKITGGSISIDGSSSLRRSCNLSMVADSYGVIEYGKTELNMEDLLSMNKKISVEIGFINTFNKYLEYETIWFPLGIFVIINSSCSNSASGLNISLQLKDKMCLLNGECGGVIPASTTFHEYEYFDYETGTWAIDKPLIYQIILELVNHLGGEDLTRILITDIPNEIKQVMKWGDETKPLYIYSEGKGSQIYADVNREELWKNILAENPNADETCLKKYSYGQDVGFVYTPFTYPGELICGNGETVCSVLDKIKETLGNYEYFYDIEGNFIFREIKNYLNTNQATSISNNLQNNPNYVVDYWEGSSIYKFDDSVLVSSYTNNPQYSMIKNDFVVWGERESASGEKLPIRFHLAIDEKPLTGNSYTVYVYEDEIDKVYRAKRIFNTSMTSFSSAELDIPKNGRYFQLTGISSDFFEKGLWIFKSANKKLNANYRAKIEHPNGKIIMEKYLQELKDQYTLDVGDGNYLVIFDEANNNIVTYDRINGETFIYRNDQNFTTIQDIYVTYFYSFSSQEYSEDASFLDEQNLHDTNVIYQIGDKYYQYNAIEKTYINVNPSSIKTIKTYDWRSELYFQGITSSLYGTDANDYYVELVNEWPKLYDITFSGPTAEKATGFWNETLEGVNLDYFLDMINSSSSEIGKYSVGNIGRRAKVINDNKINCIFEPPIPNIVWLLEGEDNTEKYDFIKKQGYDWYQTDKRIWNKIIGGGHFNSAFVLIQDLLYQYTQYNETISVTSLPIYYLEPNTRVEVNDIKSGIAGDYIIKSFSIPFDINGTMTLSCVKVLEKI